MPEEMDHDPSDGGENNEREHHDRENPEGFPDRPERHDSGREFGRTIEVRDHEYDRHDSVHEKSLDHDTSPEHNSIGRERDDKSPHTGNEDRPHGRSEKSEREPQSKSAQIGEKIKIILDNGYLNNKIQVTNLIRSGNPDSTNFNAGRESAKEDVDRGIRSILVGIVKALLGFATVGIGTSIEMLKPSSSEDDETGLDKINSDLDKFIFEKQHPQEVRQLKDFHISKFPDLKTPEELNQREYKQNYNYFK